MRFLQIIMTIVIMAFAVWFSAIMFGPWAIMKYAENQFGNRIILHNVNVNSKLEAKINRVDFNHDKIKSSSFRGVEVRWSLLSGQPKLMIDVSSANYEDQYLLYDVFLEINKTADATNYPIAINARAERLEALGSWNISNFEAEFLTNAEFSHLSNFKSKSGNLDIKGPFDLQSDRLQADAKLIRLNVNEEIISDEILLNLDKVTSIKNDVFAEKVFGKIIPKGQTFEFDVEATNTEAFENVFSSEKINALGKYDLTSGKIVEGLLIEIEKAELLGRTIIKSKSQINLNEGISKIISEGLLEETEINFGGNYIGFLPSSLFNFTAKSEAMDNSNEVGVIFDIIVPTAPEVEISIESSALTTSINVIENCLYSKCDVSDIELMYSIKSEGHQMSGVSECYDITCSSNSSKHDITTSDTNQFFQKMQKTGIFNPLILGIAYTQMLGGLPDGSGHKLSF